MKVSIFGSGYVGLVTGVCLAEMGNEVLCVDVDSEKIALLNQGGVPIYEPGLSAMIRSNRDEMRLFFSTDIKKAVDFATVQIIAVGTPPDEDGSADLQYVRSVASGIAEHMQDYKVIVDKSTVPVGTAEKVKETVKKQLAKRQKNIDFDVVSNPEFLKEGNAIADFMKPDRIIIGVESEKAQTLMAQLYASFNRNHNRVIMMDLPSAELTKYASNAMLASKISFMNELSNIADRLGADIEQVRIGMGADKRIGSDFIYPGVGYGGSCFPKDVKALERSAKQVGYQATLLQAVEAVNQKQKQLMAKKIANYFADLNGKKIALWGLAFKPNTDDMREAPSRVLMASLWQAGAIVQAFDPEAMTECQRIYGDNKSLVLCADMYETLNDADALVVMTEWNVFRCPDFALIKKRLKNAVIFDGRNIYNPQTLKALGFDYLAIGRPVTSHPAK